jgi:hypothetical protein
MFAACHSGLKTLFSTTTMKLIIATVVAAALSSCATAAQAKMYYFKDFSANFLVQP